MYLLLKTLVLPPVSLLLLIFLGLLWWRRPLLGRGLVFLSALGILLLSLPITAALLMAPLESYPALMEDDLRNPDVQAIVVLSSELDRNTPEYGGDTVGSRTLKRVRYAAWLQRRTGLPLIVSGGRFPRDQFSHAEIMRRVLEQELGVPVFALEERSTDTLENGAFTAELLKRHGLRHIFLVTQAWHMPRAVPTFERYGVEVTPAPTGFEHHDGGELELVDFLPGPGPLKVSYFAFHEYLGRLWYRIREAME